MSFHVQKWPDISNGWSDIPSKKEAKGEKTMGGKIGRKERKKKEEKKRSQQNKRKERDKEGGGGGGRR